MFSLASCFNTLTLVASRLALLFRLEAISIAVAAAVIEGLACLCLLIECVVDDVLVARTRLFWLRTDVVTSHGLLKGLRSIVRFLLLYSKVNDFFKFKFSPTKEKFKF
jgi:hypothetical protein